MFDLEKLSLHFYFLLHLQNPGKLKTTVFSTLVALVKLFSCPVIKDLQTVAALSSLVEMKLRQRQMNMFLKGELLDV